MQVATIHLFCTKEEHLGSSKLHETMHIKIAVISCLDRMHGHYGPPRTLYKLEQCDVNSSHHILANKSFSNNDEK